MKPYIGITGFKTIDEVTTTTHYATQAGYPNTHTVMFGYLTSPNRIHDPEHGGRRSPAVKELRSLVEAAPSWGLPVLHYFVADVGRLEKDMDYLVDESGASAVQLNLNSTTLATEPLDPVVLERIRNRHPDLAIILQLPTPALSGKPMARILEESKPYDELIAYGLVDPSMGAGRLFDMEKDGHLLQILQQGMPHTTFGIAGGFDHQNVRQRMQAVAEYAVRPYSIDAEGGLMEDNTLVLSRVRSYLSEARAALRTYQ